MGTRHPDFRRAKTHRTYTFPELAALFDVHINTVRGWQRDGLAPVDDRRPTLFRGDAVREFLSRRRASAKQPCGPGRIYCLPCRGPKEPAGGMVDYEAQTPTSGWLVGLCPDCGRMMFRRVSKARLPDVTAGLDVQFPHAHPSLREG